MRKTYFHFRVSHEEFVFFETEVRGDLKMAQFRLQCTIVNKSNVTQPEHIRIFAQHLTFLSSYLKHHNLLGLMILCPTFTSSHINTPTPRGWGWPQLSLCL